MSTFPGEPQGPIATGYAAYVCGFVVLDVLNGEIVQDGLDEIARDVVSGTKSWIDVGEPEQISGFLRTAASGEAPPQGKATEDFGGHAFVVGGYLLSRYRHEGQRWYQYLDDAWNAVLREGS